MTIQSKFLHVPVVVRAGRPAARQCFATMKARSRSLISTDRGIASTFTEARHFRLRAAFWPRQEYGSSLLFTATAVIARTSNTRRGSARAARLVARTTAPTVLSRSLTHLHLCNCTPHRVAARLALVFTASGRSRFPSAARRPCLLAGVLRLGNSAGAPPGGFRRLWGSTSRLGLRPASKAFSSGGA
jgi:hypothetical protein